MKHRLIKQPDRPLPGVEVEELTERDSGFALLEDFGIETTQEPETPLELEPIDKPGFSARAQERQDSTADTWITPNKGGMQ
jgi:hypothetical protein